MNTSIFQKTTHKVLMFFLGGLVLPVMSASINSITTGKNANNEYEVQLGGSDLSGANAYSLSNPARIVVDIPNAKSHLVKKEVEISHPAVSKVIIIEGDDRVRATINLSKALPYRLLEKKNRITVVISDSNRMGSNTRKLSRKAAKNTAANVAGVDFSRGNEGQGQVTISLPNPDSIVNVHREGKAIVARLTGGYFGQARRLNVRDFGTPVKTIDVVKNNIRILTNNDNFELVSYQNGKNFLIELNKPTKIEKEQSQLLPGDSAKKYTGDPLSLNFQDIEVRAVLQLIGDFTDTNIVVSDAVQGSITLRMNDVPWDQVLDIILQTKGLSKQQNGDVIYVAPSKDIADSKRAAYDVANVEKELAPLQQQLIQIQYARAEDIEKIIEDNSNTGAVTGAGNQQTSNSVDGLLSSRGRVSTDPRTNTIIINDVPSSIEKVRRLIGQLDVPVDQVLIDARVIVTSDSFAHELGIRWGGAFTGATDDLTFGGSGKLAGASGITSSANKNIAKTGQAFPTTVPSLANRLGVDLAAPNPAGSFGLSILGSDFLLDMELSAMESEGRGEIISSPRVIAQDGGEAEIEQGTQIPYETTKVTKDGGTVKVTEFKDVPLKLVVRPKIAPNNQVDMELEITKDSVGQETDNGLAIDTSNVKTQVLVDNGETVVLGGVYEQQKTKTITKVPVLGDLPIVGRAFRKDINRVRKNELLIFVTPKIVDKRYTSRDKFTEIRK